MPPITILRLGTPGAATCARLGGYTDWIARHLSGEIRVVDILGGETAPAHDDCRAVILTGSAHMVDERQPWSEALRPWLQTAVARELPVFGICYDHQLLADALGGMTGNNPRGAENGNITLRRLPACDDDPLFAPLPPTFTANATHIQSVLRLPQGAVALVANDHDPHQAYRIGKCAWGVQFHPEVTHTKKGLELLTNFVVNICGCETKWTAENIIEDAVARIKEQVGDDEVILGLSGGVDSSVVALLLHRAIGKNLHCVFVDNGLLRLNEGDQVMEMFGNKFGLNITRVDAESRFLGELAGVSDPEAKRKIIGKVFVDVFDDESKKLTKVKWLAQGTIYPDVIESAASKTGKAHVIKSHHNVGGLPDYMKLGLVEPLRELFKDEVRKIGLALGLPAEMINRHPFPGPGLGVRVLGEVKKEYCDLLRRADAIFIEELRNSGWYEKTSQAFSVFLPVKSVGVMGDGRKYDWVISLRAVETIDFMTAHWAHLPYDLLGKVSNRIINEVNGISRVVYDISGKPPATIEWE